MNLRRLGPAAALLACASLIFTPLPASAALVQIDPAYNTVKFDTTTNSVKATTADGADVTLGATADAACGTDNGTCTIEAVLKRVAQRLTTLNTTLGSPMQATGGTVTVTQATAASLNAQVQGNVASAAADSGNPVKVGCIAAGTLPTVTAGQRVDAQCDVNGNLNVQLGTNLITDSDGRGNTVGLVWNVTKSTTGMLAIVPHIFNGSTWDREFTCASSAIVSVTAGSTTQIVALSGSTVTRICSIALSMSAAGTAGVYTGTGTNCGTGTTALIQDMTLATGTPLSLSAPSGGSLVRSSAGGEICVKAVTGNVAGVITYAQF